MIHSNYGFQEVHIENILVKLHTSNYTALFYTTGIKNITIEKAIIVSNRLNRFSHLIYLSFNRSLIIRVQQSKFLANKVFRGGCISLNYEGIDFDTKLLVAINQSIIKLNYANHGAIFYVNTSSASVVSSEKILNALKNAFVNNNNTISKNKAELGEIVYWDGVYPPTSQGSSFEIFNNKNTKTLEEEIGTSINKFQLYSDTTLNNRLNALQIQEYIVQNKKKTTGFYFCLTFIDKKDRVLSSYWESGLNLEFENRVNSMGFINEDNNRFYVDFNYKRGLLCAKRFRFENYSKLLGNYMQINISSSHLPHDAFLYLNLTTVSPIEVGFVIDKCKQGELYDNLNEYCTPCGRNTFSDKENLQNLAECVGCSELNIYNCYGANMLSPKKSFWRTDSESKNFLKCPFISCLGDLDFEKNFTQRECLNCFLPLSNKELLFYSFDKKLTAIGYCSYGYTGALCSECIPGFGSELGRKCGDCAKKLVYVKHFIVLLIKLILFFYVNWKAIKSKSSNQDYNSEEFVENIKKSYMMKILFRHMNYLALLQILPTDLGAIISEPLTILSNASPSENFDIFSSEYVLYQLGITYPTPYAKLIFSLFFFSISLCILLVISAKRLKSEEKKFFRKFKFFARGVIITFFMDNLVVILNSFQPVLFCTNIGDNTNQDQRLISYLGLKCYNKLHYYYSYILSLPIIILSVIVIPLFLFFKITKAKSQNKLYSPEFLREFGYFIFPYKDDFAFFELVTFLNKVILVSMKPIFIGLVIQNQERTSVLILFIYLMTFYVIQILWSPYKNEHYSILQKLEVLSLGVSVSNAVVTVIWILNSEKQEENSFLLLLSLFFFITNVLFGLSWLKSYFIFIKNKVLTFINKFEFLEHKFSKTLANLKSITSKMNSPLKKKETDAQIIKQLREENDRLKIKNALLIERIRILEKKPQLKTVNINAPQAKSPISFRNINMLPLEPNKTDQDSFIENFEHQLENVNDNEIIYVVKKVGEKREKQERVETEVKETFIRTLEDEGKQKRKALALHSKTLVGDSFYSAYLAFELEYRKGIDCNQNFSSPINYDNDWSVTSTLDYPKNQLIIHFMKNSLWSAPPYRKHLNIYFHNEDSDLNSPDNIKTNQKTVILEMEISLSDFISVGDIEWNEETSKDKSQDSNPFNTLLIPQEALRKLKTVASGKKSGTLKVGSPVLKDGKEVLRFMLTDTGSISVQTPIIYSKEKESILESIMTFFDSFI